MYAVEKATEYLSIDESTEYLYAVDESTEYLFIDESTEYLYAVYQATEYLYAVDMAIEYLPTVQCTAGTATAYLYPLYNIHCTLYNILYLYGWLFRRSLGL